MYAHPEKRMYKGEDILAFLQDAPTKDLDRSRGDVLEIDAFQEHVRDRLFIDYDGFGKLVIDGRVIQDSTTYLSDKAFAVDDGQITRLIKIQAVRRLFGKRAQVLWFNR